MSFSEMMESGRGPGVIGMLLALLVLVGFGALFVFAFDEGLQGKAQSIESVIAHQARELSDMENTLARNKSQLELEPARVALKNRLAELKKENQTREAHLASLKSGIEDAGKSLAALKDEFEDYKNQYRALVRKNAKGETMEKLETNGGDVYVNVTVREVTPIGMQIMHAGGLKRIAFEELSPAMQERFQFDPEQKAAALAEEQARHSEHEAAVSSAVASQQQVLEEQKKADAEARRVDTVRAIAMKESRAKSLKDEIMSLERALPMESLKRISHAPQMRLQLANKQRELSTLEAEIVRMQAEVSQ